MWLVSLCSTVLHVHVVHAQHTQTQTQTCWRGNVPCGVLFVLYSHIIVENREHAYMEQRFMSRSDSPKCRVLACHRLDLCRSGCLEARDWHVKHVGVGNANDGVVVGAEDRLGNVGSRAWLDNHLLNRDAVVVAEGTAVVVYRYDINQTE